MRNIRISEEVWQAIAKEGKFGETEEDVLRRVFKLPSISTGDDDQANLDRGRRLRVSGRRISFATSPTSVF